MLEAYRPQSSCILDIFAWLSGYCSQDHNTEPEPVYDGIANVILQVDLRFHKFDSLCHGLTYIRAGEPA